MAKPKRRETSSLNVHLAPEVRQAAEELAKASRRSITTLVEFLIAQEYERIERTAPDLVRKEKRRRGRKK
jgi:predicted HicB family RNase H-like nuclease